MAALWEQQQQMQNLHASGVTRNVALLTRTRVPVGSAWNEKSEAHHDLWSAI